MKKKIFIYLSVTIGILHFIVLNSGYFNYALSQTGYSTPHCNIKLEKKNGSKSDGSEEVLCVQCFWVTYAAETSSDGTKWIRTEHEESVLYDRINCIGGASSSISCTQSSIESATCPTSESGPPDSGTGSGTGI